MLPQTGKVHEFDVQDPGALLLHHFHDIGRFHRLISSRKRAILTRTGEHTPGWREGREARRWRCWYAIRQPQRRWTFPLSTTAALSICRNQRQNLTPPRLRRPYRSLSCEVVGTGAVVGEVGIGNGLMMTTDFGFGGPCPPPSCATVTVAADDAMTRKVTIAYFILTLLRAQKGAATATSVRDPQRTSPADASKRAASGNCSGGPRNLTSLVRKKIDLPSERRRPLSLLCEGDGIQSKSRRDENRAFPHRV